MRCSRSWRRREEEGVEPTNNFAERMIRFGVLRRKRFQGTNSDKENRWVERILYAVTSKNSTRIFLDQKTIFIGVTQLKIGSTAVTIGSLVRAVSY